MSGSLVACLLAGGQSLAQVARDTHHDWRTVKRVVARPTGRKHGGARRDILGDDGRALLERLVALCPKAKDEWYAKCMTKMLDREVKVGVVRTAFRHLRIRTKEETTLYSECDARPRRPTPSSAPRAPPIPLWSVTSATPCSLRPAGRASSCCRVASWARRARVSMSESRLARRGITEYVVVEQRAFMRFFARKTGEDASFQDKVVWVDVTSFNELEIQSRRRARGKAHVPVMGHAKSDRGNNWDFVGGINRVRGLLAPYMYDGASHGHIAALRRRL